MAIERYRNEKAFPGASHRSQSSGDEKGEGEWREEGEEKRELERRGRIPRLVRDGDVTVGFLEDGSVKYPLGPESDCGLPTAQIGSGLDCYDAMPAAQPLSSNRIRLQNLSC